MDMDAKAREYVEGWLAENQKATTTSMHLDTITKQHIETYLEAHREGMEEAANVADTFTRTYEVYEPRGQLVRYTPGAVIAAAIREMIK